jgi:hypothetical protein
MLLLGGAGCGPEESPPTGLGQPSGSTDATSLEIPEIVRVELVRVLGQYVHFEGSNWLFHMTTCELQAAEPARHPIGTYRRVRCEAQQVRERVTVENVGADETAAGITARGSISYQSPAFRSAKVCAFQAASREEGVHGLLVPFNIQLVTNAVPVVTLEWGPWRTMPPPPSLARLDAVLRFVERGGDLQWRVLQTHSLEHLPSFRYRVRNGIVEWQRASPYVAPVWPGREAAHRCATLRLELEFGDDWATDLDSLCADLMEPAW